MQNLTDCSGYWRKKAMVQADAGHRHFTRRPVADRGGQWCVQITCPGLVRRDVV